MFKKKRCSGCRKDKYLVKYLEIKAPFGRGEPLRSMEKLCLGCRLKLKKIAKNVK